MCQLWSGWNLHEIFWRTWMLQESFARAPNNMRYINTKLWIASTVCHFIASSTRFCTGDLMQAHCSICLTTSLELSYGCHFLTSGHCVRGACSAVPYVHKINDCKVSFWMVSWKTSLWFHGMKLRDMVHMWRLVANSENTYLIFTNHQVVAVLDQVLCYTHLRVHHEMKCINMLWLFASFWQVSYVTKAGCTTLPSSSRILYWRSDLTTHRSATTATHPTASIAVARDTSTIMKNEHRKIYRCWKSQWAPMHINWDKNTNIETSSYSMSLNEKLHARYTVLEACINQNSHNHCTHTSALMALTPTPPSRIIHASSIGNNYSFLPNMNLVKPVYYSRNKRPPPGSHEYPKSYRIMLWPQLSISWRCDNLARTYLCFESHLAENKLTMCMPQLTTTGECKLIHAQCSQKWAEQWQCQTGCLLSPTSPLLSHVKHTSRFAYAQYTQHTIHCPNRQQQGQFDNLQSRIDNFYHHITPWKIWTFKVMWVATLLQAIHHLFESPWRHASGVLSRSFAAWLNAYNYHPCPQFSHTPQHTAHTPSD